jgi:nitrate reductase gamma subunit
LWEQFFGIGLPALPGVVADGLTLLSIACLLTLLGYRSMVRRARDLSGPSDYLLLILLITVFTSGYMASHPSANPIPWQAMMLLHVLSGECLLIAVPFTKLSHIVLAFFDRLSPVHWKFRPGAGDRVAEALFGEEAKV